MSTNPSARNARLRSFLNAVLHGEKPVGQQGDLFLDAVSSHQDPPACINNIIASDTGLSSLKEAIHSNFSESFFNGSVATFLQYLQAPALKTIGSGQYLTKVILAIVDPPIFWLPFVNAFRDGHLQENTQRSFAWLLLQLIMIPGEAAAGYRKVAEDKSTLHLLLNLSHPEGKAIGQHIQKVLSTSAAAVHPEHGYSPGGRHDNDFVDFREIAILPTADEIASKDQPFLRRSSALDDPETLDVRTALYLDNQFRLLRDDMMYEMREEMTMVLGLKNGKGGRATVIDGLTIFGVHCGPVSRRSKWGLALMCNDDLPQLKGQSGFPKRKAYLKDDHQGKKVLKHQSLVCLLVDGHVSAFPTINRDEELLAKEPPIIVLQFDWYSVSNITKMLLELKNAKNIKLVQINTAVFSYEPILSALQNIKDLPLSQELLFWESGSGVELVNHGSKMESLVRMIQNNPHKDLGGYLGSSKSIVLDKAQEASLLSGLTQTVSLIQGPPGTGKSFIGAILAKFIHDYTEQTILVVCYTNHALDQFLEDLVGIGIPHESLVRLGGKSNPQTEHMSLFKQTPVSKATRADWKMRDDCKAEAEIYAQSLNLAFDEYKKSSVAATEIMAHIEFEDCEYFKAFSIPTSEDGMTHVGKQGRAVDPNYLLNQWFDGKNAGPFKQRPQVLNAAKIWGMSLAARQARAAMWKTDILKYQVDGFCGSAKLYNQCQTELQRKFEEKNVDILRSKRIIGCTTTGAAKYREVIQGASPDVLLVEEAGEILESHVIVALGADAKQMILIGDHKQLRPKVNHYDLTVEKGEGYDLNRSLFERLVLKGYPHSTLISQHRMRPEISELIRHLTYPDLTDAPRTSSRPNLRGVCDNIVFIDHTKPEDDNRDLADRRDMNSKSSKQNSFEVEMVLKIVRYLIQQGYKSEDLVVLTPYLGQLQELRRALSQETDPVLNDLDMYELIRAGVMTLPGKQPKKPQLRLITIDNYQGEESDVVITSLCRSNSNNDIGFMSSPERLNVLLSRARNALIMIGNATTFTNARKGKVMWSQLLQLLRSRGHVYDGFPVSCSQHPSRTALLKIPADFTTECPDGGCNSPCGAQLSCGIHTCPSKCHPSTLIRHTQVLCQQIIDELCPQGHPQSRKCHQPAHPCTVCRREAAAAERERRKEFERQQKIEAQKTEHDRRLKDLEEKIDAELQIVKDAQIDQQRAQILRQKQDDLNKAKSLAESVTAALFSFIPSFPTSSTTASSQTAHSPGNNPPPIGKPNPNVTPGSSHQSSPRSPSRNLPHSRAQTPPGNPATSRKSSPEDEWKRQKDIEGASCTAIDAVMDMIGLEDVKRQILRIKDKIEVTQRQGTPIEDERFNVVFLGNPGTGKTTVARQYAKFLKFYKILPGPAFKETTGAVLAHEGVDGAKKLINEAINAGGGVIFIDEAYQLTSQHGHSSHHGGQVLDFLLAEMENRIGMLVFILAGYSKQMEKFFEHNPGLRSRVPYTLKFADYTDDELLLMFARLVQKKYHGKMKVQEGVKGLYSRIFVRRLGRGRGREGFGNARDLENMFAKMTERQAERISLMRRKGQRPDDFYLQMEDIIGPDPKQAIKRSAAWIDLQALTGLQAVKESVGNLFDLVCANYHRELAEQKPLELSLNRVFLGSPGTGKTTVGKLYGQILADIGMLSNGEVVVKNPSDFVGSYIGHSEANTKAILASTIGKVLIIDEAYMLFGGRGDHTSHTDSFKTAVIDTIVAEVQSVPGEDRCVLLLGYEAQMREMFQNVNEGLSRRFAIEDAFKFEDFTDAELREILDGKLKKQDLSATDPAKNVAMELLGRERKRPNFGNGGAVENLLGQTKTRYMARMRGSMPPVVIVLEPHDFDPDFDRYLHADKNLDKLFEDIVGCNDIIDKLRGYQKVSRVMKARNEEMGDMIPTTFIFTGPPGTGKTTIARKIGQVYYDMGFLSSSKVEECSASDLVGQYVGHTGPKTKKLFEKALGQVLFIDEAYRLGEGRFAQEAVDELVGILTQERFKSKIVVILAGYEQDINKLLNVNSGLSSRFPVTIPFKNFPSKSCLEILDKALCRQKITLAELRNPSSKGYSVMESVVEDLSAMPSWANARDMETLAKEMGNLVMKRLPESGQPGQLSLSVKDAVDVMLDMLNEQRRRSNMPRKPRSGYEDIQEDLSSSHPPPNPPSPAATQQSSSSSPPPPPQQQQQKQKNRKHPSASRGGQESASRPPAPPSAGQSSSHAPPLPHSPTSRSGSNSQSPSTPSSSRQQRPKNISQSQPKQSPDPRDDAVSDAIWEQLLADKQAAERAEKALENETRQAKRKLQQAIQDEEKKRAAARAAAHAEAIAKDEAARQEAKRQREEHERKERAAAAARQRLAAALQAKRKAEENKKREEDKVQTALRSKGVCVQGYQWVKQQNGYRCAGGAHFIYNSQL